MTRHQPAAMKEHERLALEYLSTTPDRIRYITDENTMAAALTYTHLRERGLVHIDRDDGMLVTITDLGLRVLAHANGNAEQQKDGDK